MSPAASSQVLALARAIAEPGPSAMLITTENAKRGAWLSVDDAASTGESFAVRVTEDTVAIDADNPELVGALDDLSHALPVPTVLIASGRPGHRHLFAAGGRQHVRVKARAAAFGFAVRQVIRPPGSPHRLGLPVRFLDPEDDPAEALARLTRVPTPLPPLSSVMVQLMATGVSTDYDTRSEMIAALALSAVNAGWTLREFSTVLLASAAGQKVREKGAAAARQWMALTWRNAVARATTSPPVATSDASVRVAAIRQAMAADTWRGSAGNTNRIVLEAHLSLCERTGKLEYAGALRTVAEQAGLPLPSVDAGQDRLQATGWLRCVTPGARRAGRAAIWTLRVPPKVLVEAHSSVGGREEECFNQYPPLPPIASTSTLPRPSEAASHDVWRGKPGLGKARFLVYRQLGDEPVPARDLAQRLGRQACIVRRHLRVLAHHQLALRSETGWCRGPADLDVVAHHLASAGAGRHQRQVHAQHRAAHRAARATRFGNREARL